jgi:hypothetical protein
MVPQLSTTDRDSQPPIAIRFHYLANQVGKLCLLGLLAVYSTLSVGQDTDLEVRIEPLTAIDQQFMSEQRVRVEQLANRLGRNLSGRAARDIDTLQRLLDDGLVPATDTLALPSDGSGVWGSARQPSRYELDSLSR